MIDSDAELGIPGLVSRGLLGTGGFGAVYRAHQEAMHRDVAVKVLLDTDSESAVAWFERERRALAALTEHPNIVNLLAAGATAAGRPYLIMPLLTGGSLADKCHAAQAVPLEKVLSWGVSLAGALAAAHDADILHRDIKPANVMFSRYGEPLLADFGIATLAAEHATEGGGHTPAFAAPEVLRGSAATEVSDVYGLAATLFAAVNLVPPYFQRDGESVGDLTFRVVNGERDGQWKPETPSELESVIEAALERDPRHRTPSAFAFAEQLQGAQGSLGQSLTPIISLSGRDGFAWEGASDGPLRESVTTTPSDLVWAPPTVEPTLADSPAIGANPPSPPPMAPPTLQSESPAPLEAPTVPNLDWHGVTKTDVDPAAVTRQLPAAPAALAAPIDAPDHVGSPAASNETAAAKSGGDPKQEQQRRPKAPALLAVLGVTTALFVLLGLRQTGSTPTIDIEPSATFAMEDATTATVSTEGSPVRALQAFDAYWVSDFSSDQVLKIEPSSGEIAARIDVGDGPVGLAAAVDAVWVANHRDDSISAIDPASGEVRQTVELSDGDGPHELAVTSAGLWVVNARPESTSGNVALIEPATGEILSTVGVGQDPLAIAADPDGGVWATAASSGELYRISASGELEATVNVGGGPRGVTVLGPSVWVANLLDGQVAKVDRGTNTVELTMEVPGEPFAVSAHDGWLWVTLHDVGSLVALNTESGWVSDPRAIGPVPRGVAAGEEVLVALREEGELLRLTPPG